MPRSTSVAIAMSPTGPHPNTATLSPAQRRPGSPPACRPRAARRARRPAAACRRAPRNNRRPLAASRTSSSGVEPALRRSAAEPAAVGVGGVDDDPVTDGRVGDLGADPLDDARHLVPERLGPAGDTAHVHERHVGAADAACARSAPARRAGPGRDRRCRRAGRRSDRARGSASSSTDLPTARVTFDAGALRASQGSLCGRVWSAASAGRVRARSPSARRSAACSTAYPAREGGGRDAVRDDAHRNGGGERDHECGRVGEATLFDDEDAEHDRRQPARTEPAEEQHGRDARAWVRASRSRPAPCGRW